LLLSEDKLHLAHDLIAELYARPFDQTLAMETAKGICGLVDAHYYALLLFPSNKNAKLLILSNNPPDFLPIYFSVQPEDFLIETLVSTGRECVLRRMPDYDQPKNQNFIAAVQHARPISDMAYFPIKTGDTIRGIWAFGRAGLRSSYYTDDDIAVVRFIVGFLNDAFERSLLPPPLDEDMACLDFEGHILGAGARIQEVFDSLFERGSAVEAGKRLGLQFRKGFEDFLRCPFEPGMDRLCLRSRGREHSFSFGILDPGRSPIKQAGVPFGTARLLEWPGGMLARRSPNEEMAAGVLQFSNRERDVLSGIYKGKTNKEIAWLLGIDESTVKRYTHNIYEKTGFRSRVELVLGLPAMRFLQL
jgi:DNA-binding CsgD family transcriptional regulator